MSLTIRTSREMVELNENEAAELRERLGRLPAAQPAEETIAVSANASTSVTFTELQKAAVLEVLDLWLDEAGKAVGDGPARLRDALRGELERRR
jgi:delta 1-pyrroline-5-carboxylate dehydrogenase